MSEMNLYQKLHAIMQEMDNIPKSGRHPKQGWAFHQANDIFNGARSAFIKHRVIIVPGCIPEHTSQIVERVTKSGQRGDYEQVNTRTNIVFTYTFIDIDSGEKLDTAWPGESVDYDDKGTQQAGTSSMKYMLMKMFLATPDHDPDYNSVDTETGEITTPPVTAGAAKEILGSGKKNGKVRKIEGEAVPGAPAAFIGSIMNDKTVQGTWQSPVEARATINKMWVEGKLDANTSDEDAILAVIERLQSHREPDKAVAS